MENNTQLTQDIKVKTKRRVLATFSVLAGVTVGTTLYLMGRADGFKLGAVKGHAVGYKEAVSEVGSILKEFSDYNKLKDGVDDL